MTSKEAQAAFDIGREPAQGPRALRPQRLRPAGLLARRLVEAGVPFVTLYDGGWDHHTEPVRRRSRSGCPTWDNSGRRADRRPRRSAACSTATLVIALGEFGRTPKINKDAGRDHWSNAMSVLFAGGGTPGGQVVGATDSKGYAAVERVLSPENFVSTVYAKLGIDPGKILLHAAGPPGAPRQRPDADQGADVSRRINHRDTETQRRQAEREFQRPDSLSSCLLCVSVSLWLVLLPRLRPPSPTSTPPVRSAARPSR